MQAFSKIWLYTEHWRIWSRWALWPNWCLKWNTLASVLRIENKQKWWRQKITLIEFRRESQYLVQGGNCSYLSPGLLQILPPPFNYPSCSPLLSCWSRLKMQSRRQHDEVSYWVPVWAASPRQDHNGGRTELQVKKWWVILIIALD